MHPKIYYLFLFSLLLVACQKKESDENKWDACYSCTVDSWVGEYSGTCEYFNANTNLTVKDISFTLTIEQTATEYLTAYIVVPNYYSTSISGDFNTPNYISFGASSSSLDATMYTSGTQFRLTGNSKKFHYKTDSLIIDEVINFESLKNLNP